MANRNFSRDMGMMERGAVVLTGQIPISSAAAVGTITDFQGVLSVVKSSTATYTVTLQDKYLKLLGCSLQVYGGTVLGARLSAAPAVSSTTPTVTFITTNGSGVETANTTSTATVLVTLWLRNSKGNPGES